MRLARGLGPRWDEVNARHIHLICAVIAKAGGTIVRTEGDAIFAVFPEAIAAVAAAADAQRALTAEPWPEDGTDPRPDGTPHRRGASVRRRLRRLRCQSRGACRRSRPRRPGRAVGDDRDPCRGRPARRHGAARSRPAHPARRPARRAAPPARHRRTGVGLPATSDRRRPIRQPARSAHVVPGPRPRARGARRAPGGGPARDADGTRRHRQVEPRHRGGARRSPRLPGRRVVHQPRRNR